MSDKSKHVMLSCPNHHEELIGGLWNFLNTKYRVDFDVQWSGRSVRAHQLILDIFLPPEKLDRRALTDKRSNLESLLEFMYKGKVSVRQEELDNLCWVAKKLNFKMLADAIRCAKRSPANARTRPRRQRRNSATKRPPVEATDDVTAVDSAGQLESVTMSQSLRLGDVAGIEAGGDVDVLEWHGIIESLSSGLNWEAATAAAAVKGSESGNGSMDRQPSLDEVSASTLSPAEYMRLWRQKQPFVKCEHCSYRTRYKRDYGAHLAKHHPGVPIPKCETCRQTFFDQDSLVLHKLKQHSADGSRTLDGGDVTKSVSGSDNENFPHVSQQQQQPAIEAGAGDPTLSETDRKRMYRQRMRLVKCSQCSYETRDRRHYGAHMSKHHPGVPVPKCSACKQTFFDQASLIRHRLKQHLMDDSSGLAWLTIDESAGSTVDGCTSTSSGDVGGQVAADEKGGTVDSSMLSKAERNRLYRQRQRLVKCDHCPYSTRDKRYFATHIKRHHPGVQVPTCEKCGQTFFDLDSLSRHRLKQHLMVHSAEYVRVNVDCDGSGLGQSDAAGQGRTMDDDEKRMSKVERDRMYRQNRPLVKCEYCDYVTRDKRYYATHLTKHHPTMVTTKCGTCQRAFPDAEGLTAHLAKYSGGCSAIHKCAYCYYETPAQINMYRHLYARHGVNAKGKPVLRKHRCAECDYAALIPSQLKNHVLAKHSGLKPFKCHRCPYATYHKGARDNHVRKVHLGQKPYMCEICGKTSASQCNLDRHRRTHTGERPFPCSICGLAFADRYTLNGHVRSKHTQERPFVCHVCAHAFRRLDNLRVHLKKVHQTR